MPQKVLLIEDSMAFAAILQGSIRKIQGFEVDCVSSLKDTQKQLAEHANEYFMAIVDYHLPDAPDGEAIDCVAQYDIPIVVFTGSNDSGLKEDLWSKGITDYAHKQGPYNLEYIVWLVKRLYSNKEVDVLIVDDSRVTRRGIERLLRTQRLQVHSAASAAEALKILSEKPEIKLAVIDCHMEGMSGIELTSKIREKHSTYQLEIIGISAEGGRKLSAQFIKAGANDFIVKPFLPEELLCRVNKSIDRLENYAELQRLNQLKNQFLSTAAHDIRGPLAATKTAADYMLRSSNEERRESLLQMISNNSSSLIELLESLLDISSIESGDLSLNLQEVDLSNLINERIHLYQSESAAKQLSCQTDISTPLNALIDPVKIRQLVDNLITNAIKYSFADGEYRVSLTSNDVHWTLAIQDAGPGIASDEQEHLFKPFSDISTHTTAGEKKTGLGLTIAKSVVDAHKGKIFYQHDDQQHSTFFVEIPLLPKI